MKANKKQIIEIKDKLKNNQKNIFQVLKRVDLAKLKLTLTMGLCQECQLKFRENMIRPHTDYCKRCEERILECVKIDD